MSDDALAPPALASVVQRVDELEALLRRALSDLEDLTADHLSGYATPQDIDPTTAADEVPEPIYSSVTAWVDDYFRVVFTRSVGGEIRWCDQWHDHPEAVTRLEALWRSWEALRLDPNLGIATWLTTFLDPQLAALLSRSGTFAQCSQGRHTALPCLGG